jgi:methionyl-tRNA formyltransferase
MVFLGSPELAVPALRALHQAFGVGLVITQPDKPAGRGRHEASPPVKRAAVELGIPVYQPGRLRGRDAVKPLADFAPDFLIVLAYGEILSDKVLALPRIAPLNAHMSLLPRHRGPSPINAAILEGDGFTGVTTMRITKKMDTGPIYLTEKVCIRPEDTSEHLAFRLAPIAAELLVETVNGLLDETLQEHPQEGEPAYCTKLTKEHGLIRWDMRVEHIERMTRAFFPWPTAWTRFPRHGGYRAILKLLDAACSYEKRDVPPGTVLCAGDTLDVSCGNGTLLIRRLQPEGKKPMCARDFINGHPLPPGTVLG